MSLIQHVHTHDGTDREEALVDLFLPPVERQATHERERERRASLESGFGGDGNKSLRQVISYDALKPPTQPTHGEEYGGVTQYHVSTGKRLGKLTRFGIQSSSLYGDTNVRLQLRLSLRYLHAGLQVELSSASLHLSPFW
jgi:hypothetical protein